jgi:hypothetical protein
MPLMRGPRVVASDGDAGANLEAGLPPFSFASSRSSSDAPTGAETDVADEADTAGAEAAGVAALASEDGCGEHAANISGSAAARNLVVVVGIISGLCMIRSYKRLRE